MKGGSRGCSRPVLDIHIYFPGGAGAAFCIFSTGIPVKTLILVLMSHDGLYYSVTETGGMQATDQTWAAPNANGYSSIWLC